jgi:hypothetical protein
MTDNSNQYRLHLLHFITHDSCFPNHVVEELVPTKTTRTAAYVAAATKVSLLSVRNARLIDKANRIIETDTVTRLLVVDGFNDITNIGQTGSTSPAIATTKRAKRSTILEYLYGGNLSSYLRDDSALEPRSSLP